MQKETEIGVLEYIEGEYGGNFTGKTDICIFSHEYTIDIRFKLYRYGPEGLTEIMIKAAKNVLDIFQNNIEVVETAIRAYYETEPKEFAEDGLYDYIDIKSASQLAEVMKPVELFISKSKKYEKVQDVYVGLYFECDWNPDEGFGIRFNGNGDILKVGRGDVVY